MYVHVVCVAGEAEWSGRFSLESIGSVVLCVRKTRVSDDLADQQLFTPHTDDDELNQCFFLSVQTLVQGPPCCPVHPSPLPSCHL